MRNLVFWVLLAAMLAAIAFLDHSGGDTSGPVSLSAADLTGRYEENPQLPSSSRKIKEKHYHATARKGKRVLDSVSATEDYPSYDPVPSSKASVKPGPIEHGTPLMPYIPGPTPPGPWMQDATP